MNAKLSISKDRQVSKIDRRIYGSFIEHLGRAVYGGIYEPTHESADDMGFRTDVLEAVSRLNVPIVRYPGGNFVSGYNWEDGTGDKAKRPRRLELAWGALETNEMGTDEFVQWAKRANTQVMMAVNLGTRGPEQARDLIEYCNYEGGTKYSELRIANGFNEPFNIKTWCLGNEMDGPWQMCAKTADEYGRVACEAAKMMKWVDESIELVACGSSGAYMPTFGAWEKTVLRHTYEHIDYMSLHAYYDHAENDTATFLGKSLLFDEFIKTVIRICDEVGAEKKSKKQINLSMDEWNVWLACSGQEGQTFKKWSIAPAQLEDVYTFEDALVVGCLLITLLKNANRVKMACLAQLVNVIAPIMTQNGGGLFLQTIFYPFMYTSNFGGGFALDVDLTCERYDTEKIKSIPFVETIATYDESKNELAVFAVNRSQEESVEAELAFDGFEALTLIEHIVYESADCKATNSFEQPENVLPHSGGKTTVSGAAAKATLNKLSWNMIRFKVK